MRPWISALLLAGILYGILAWLASRSIYYPMRYPAGRWDLQKDMRADDVWMSAADGVKLHGWLIRRADSPLVTLHLHGNAGNITHRVETARHVYDAGSSVLLLDYRGYGRSEGRPTERGLYADADAAYEYLLKAGWSAECIVLHGESLGTAVATDLASRRRCAGLVLEAPFTSARAVAQRVLPAIGPLLVWGFDTKSKIARSRAPLLLIHGEHDEVIPYELGKELFDVAPEPKTMWTVRGATHNDLHQVGAAVVVERLRTFYRQFARV